MGMLTGPIGCGRIAAGEIASVRGVILHHLHQLLAETRIAVHDEQLHHCAGEDAG